MDYQKKLDIVSMFVLRRLSFGDHFFREVVLPFRRVTTIILLALSLFAGGTLPADTFPVDTTGDWGAPVEGNGELAWVLRNAITGDLIVLTNGISGDWSTWTQTNGYRIITSPTLSGTAGTTLNFDLGGYTLDGEPLDLVTGLTTFNFSNGTLGSAANNFGIGANGGARVTFTDGVTLNANNLLVGSASSVTLFTLQGSSVIDVASLTVTTFNTTMTLGGAGTSKVAGATLVSHGGNLVIDSTLQIKDLTVTGIGVEVMESGNYDFYRSTLSGSGTLDFITAGTGHLAFADGAEVDLSGLLGDFTATANQSLTVDGVFSHDLGAKSFQTYVKMNGALIAASGGNVAVTNGAELTGVKAITTNGGTISVQKTISSTADGKDYQSAIRAGGALTINGGAVNIEDGGIIDGVTGVTVDNAGVLNILRSNSATGFQSELKIAGTFTLGGTTVGTLNMTDGAYFSGITNAIIGGSAQAVVKIGGVGSGNTRTEMIGIGTLTVANADIDITGGALWKMDGTATLGGSGGTTLLDIGGHAGSGNGYYATLKTGEITLGDSGTARVGITKGGALVTEGAILAKGTSSVAEITINENQDPGVHRAWTVGGAGLDPGYSMGQSFLTVNAGMIEVNGFLSMGSQSYAGNYGRATFTGTNAELRMNGGVFRNEGSSDGQIGNGVGTIFFGTGGIVSGSGEIYAGDQFTVSGGLITPGGRWMYDFNRSTDNLLCLGKLDITDSAAAVTVFENATFQTQLDRETAANDVDFTNGYKESDRVVVRGALIVDNVNVNISRVLSGDYALIKAEGGIKQSDGTTDYVGFALDSLAADSLLLNLNGKPITGNDRIDRANGMYTTYNATAKEIRLHVETLTGGNVITYWTGEGNVWDMVSRNFQASSTGGTKQFLDGDIVVFDSEWMDDPLRNTETGPNGSREIIITNNDLTDKYLGSVIVPEVRVLGSGNFTWSYGTDLDGDGDTDSGSILAYDSALYTTLTQGSGYIDPATGIEVKSPSGELVKVGSGVLTINNSNSFYGGVHLGLDGGNPLDPEDGGGKIILNNERGLGVYNSTTGFQELGLVYVHQNTTIDVSAIGSIQNRFIVDAGKILTLQIGASFAISGNNALATNAINDGKGGGIFIGNGGSVVYSGTGHLELTRNLATQGGGIYTELGYLLDVPAFISGNYASGGGGGIFAERYLEMKNGSEISRNTTNSAGGGIYVANVGTITGAGDAQFILHGDTVIADNKSGGVTGGGVYVEAGRELVLSTEREGAAFAGGDIWFHGNYAKVEFNPDDPTQVVASPDQIRNALHLSRSATDTGSYAGAKLSVTGPYNVYFYDPVSGDTGTTVTITGVLADASNVNSGDILPNEQYGTVVFRDDSLYFGNTYVEDGATFRLESFTDVSGPVTAVYGRKGLLAVDSPTENEFVLDATSKITGQGTVAANDIYLNGIVDLDTGNFSQPNSRDGSGSVTDTGTKRGVLNLDGKVSVDDTAYWYLNLGASNATDVINVTGTAAFDAGAAAGEKLTLDIDDIVRGKYAVMTTTGGVTGFNTVKSRSDAEVFLLSNDSLNLVTTAPLDASGNAIFKRLNVTTYVENNNLYLDLSARNRHVVNNGIAGGNWGHNSAWTYDASYDVSNVAGSSAWMRNDTGPATSAYVDGDMVTFTGGTYTLSTSVNPVDLFVTGNVSIGGAGYGIATFSQSATAGTTILSTTVATDKYDNDYEIDPYTGKLYKTGVGTTLNFTNGSATVGNTFTHGIVFNTVSGGEANAGTIEFTRGNQLAVGAGAFVDFLNHGTLQTAATTELASNIRIEDAVNATFNVTANTLTQSGTIADLDITDHGAVVKNGAGTLELTAQNTFTGGTTFNMGTIQLGGTADPTVNTNLGRYSVRDGAAGSVYVNGAGQKDLTVDNGSYVIGNRFVVDAIATNALNVDVGTGSLTIDNAGVTGAVSTNGGAIWNQSASQLTFTGAGTLIVRNNQGSAGGGVYTGAAGTLTFNPVTTLSGNTASLEGGGLYADGDVTFAQGATVTGNTATAGSGGGIRADGIVTFGGVTSIQGNTAGGAGNDGGGIYTTGNVVQSAANATAFNLGGTTGNTAADSGGGIYTTGSVLLQGSGANTITRNAATSGQGGGIYAGTAVNLTGTTNLGATAAGTGNTAYGDGGGIYSGGTTQLAAFTAYRNVAGQGNTSTAASGGALYSTDNVTISGAVLLGSNNATGTNNYGNTARTFGGGVYSGANITLSGNTAKTIRYNTAGTSGGGLYAVGGVTIGGTGTKTISNNAATAGSGGAIYAQNITLSGPATISTNAAAVQGGAFYLTGHATLASVLSLSTGTGSTGGDVVFSGNTTTAAGGGEAAYIGVNGNVVIDADVYTNAGVSTVRVVRFDDTLVTDLTTDHTLTKIGTGMLAFTGTGNVNIFRGTTDVQAGTFRITTGTSYGYAAAGTNVFKLDGDTNNDITLSGGGTITAGTFEWRGVISPDDSALLTVADAARIGTLTLDGDVTLYGDNDPLSYQLDVNLDGVSGRTVYQKGDSDLVVVTGTLDLQTAANANKVVINLRQYTEGKYLLIQSDELLLNGVDGGVVNGIGQNGAVDVTIHDFAKTDRHRISFLRGDEKIDGSDATYVSDNANAAEAHNELWLATRYNNLYNYWTGTNIGDGAANVWQSSDNEANGNWLDVRAVTSYSSGETHVEDDDTVAFVDSFIYNVGAGNITGTPTNKAVTLGSNVVVTAMLVDTTGTYSFTDTNTTTTHFGITTSGTYSGDILDGYYDPTNTGTSDVPQTLTKRGTGILAFTNTGTNKFEKGIYFSGGTIRFTSGNQLTVGEISSGVDAKIYVKDTTVLDYNGATGGDLVTGINIDVTKTLTYNVTGTVTHTQSGLVTGAGALSKTGGATSVLVLSNTGNTYQGTTNITNGTLRAVGDATGTGLGENVSTHQVVIAGGAELELQVASGVISTLNQNISGTGGLLEKIGAGTQILTYDHNNYTGGTTVSAGTLTAKYANVDATHVGSIGTGNASLAASTVLNFDLQASGSFTGRISGAGQVTKTTAGTTLTLNNAANDFTGAVTVSGGTVGNVSKLIAVNGSSLNTTATAAITLTGVYDHLEINQTGAGSLDRVITGAGHLIKTGAGNLTLNGTNTFTGGTDLDLGTVTLGSNAALGTYVYAVATPQNGQVNLNADGTTVMNTVSRTIQNRFVVADSLGTGAADGGYITAGNSLTVQNVNSSAANADGGAIHVGTGSKLTLTVNSATAGQNLVFSNNTDRVGANDIFMATDSSLLVTGAQNTLIGSGIRGGGTVTKEGAGILQIGVDSAFTGQTNVTAGTFRVLTGGVDYGTSTTTGFSLSTGAYVTGGGTILSLANTVSGTISPDSGTGLTPTAAQRFGTLTFSGNTTLSGFTMNYDLPATAGSYGDLLKIDNAATATVSGGNVNFVGTFNTGRYLVVDSNVGITIGGNGNLDGISGGGVLGAKLNGNDLTNTSPRYGLAYVFEDGSAANSQIWLDVEVNTLTMDVSATTVNVNWDTTTDNLWASRQWATAPATSGLVKIFRDGDYVYFQPTVDQAVTVAAGGVTVSGMVVNSANDVTYTGGVITSRLKIINDTMIVGKFLDPGTGIYADPVVTPDGMLTKSGTGMLTFANAANTFNKGIVINAGTVGFSAANQLGTLDTDGTTDHGITFAGSGTLRANVSGQTLANKIVITAAGTTANVYTQANTLTLSGVISGAGNLTKSLPASGTTGGLLILSSTTGNSYDGQTTIETGTLRAMGVATLGTNAANRIVSIASGADLEVSVATGTETLDKQITGAGLVEKIGGGTLILTHTTNNYTGGTLVTGGRLVAETLGSAGSNVAAGLVTIGTGTVFELKLDALEGGTFAQRMTGAGQFIKSGTETVTLNRGDNDYTGNTEVTGGRIQAGNVGAVGNNATTSTSYINLSGTGTSIEFTGTATGNFYQYFTGQGALIKSGGGTLILNKASTNFTGGTTLTGDTSALTLNDVAALGTYTVSGSTKGRVEITGTGTKTITLGTATGTTFNNRFNVTQGTFVLTNASGVNHTIDLGVGSGTDGGAVAVVDGATMNLTNAGSITFTGNVDSTGSNDIYLGGSNALLSITGSGNSFFESGLRGTGTVTKTGTGLTQIDAASSIVGSTTVGAGRFRVNDGATYTNTGVGSVFSLSATDALNGLEGNGTVTAETITITGNIAPDSDDLDAANPTVATTGDDRFGTLTLSGTTVNLGNAVTGFTMAYDVGDAYTADNPVTPTGDLLAVTATNVNLYSGTINFSGTLGQGSYLIVDANTAIAVDTTGNASAVLDGINDTTNGVLKATVNGNAMTAFSPRALYAFVFQNSDTEIWLNVEMNSLTMDWVGGSVWNGAAANWQSRQVNGTEREDVFRDGDYVYFNTAASISIDAGTRVVSGMQVGSTSNNNVTFTGAGGIRGRMPYATDEEDIIGKYLLPSAGAERLVPDGKLTKSGTGTLTFENLGGNLFEQGIDIAGGIVAFNRADQIATGAAGIRFTGTGTLQANASAVLTNNVAVTAGNTGTINSQTHLLTFNTGAVTVGSGGTGGTLNLTTGTGGYQFYNAGIQSSGTSVVSKTGAGTVQIGATSVLNGTTTVSGGTFRVVDGVTYGGSGSFSLGSTATLSGGGTISSTGTGNTINGYVSPDNKTMTAGDTVAPTGNARFGTLTFNGNTAFGGDFRFTYDVGTPYTGTGSLSSQSALTTGDLIRLTDGTIDYAIADGVILDLITGNTDSLVAGSYHVISADRAISLSGSAATLNDAINLYRDGNVYTSTVRNTNDFVYADGSNTDIWLQIYANSLNMVWNVSGTNKIWSASTDANWNSKQGNDSTALEKIEHAFRNGDYVHFTDNAGDSIAIGGQVVVSGMEVAGAGNYTLTGLGGILSRLEATNDTEIIGKYLPGGTGNPTLTPDGLLIKSGAGTLTFDNGSDTVGNLFSEGVDIAAGTVVFSRGNQLTVGSGKAITFTGTGTLRNSQNATLVTDIAVQTGTATIDVLGNILTHTGTINVTGTGLTLTSSAASGLTLLDGAVSGTGLVTKTGSGTAQIGVNSTISGSTAVSAGTFRVAQGVSYGTAGTGTMTVAGGATIAGGGTIRANDVSVSGTISADSDTLSATKTTVDHDHRFGTLLIDANTTLQNGFVMQYDAHVDSSQSPHGDLLKVINGNTLSFGTGTINLVNLEDEISGSYLIMEADSTILHPLNADPDVVLTATLNGANLGELSVRGTYTFYQKQNGVVDPNGNQIWLDVEKNSLNMTWQENTANDVWTATSGGANWLSTQGDLVPTTNGAKERVFQNGDYVHFDTLSGDKEITVDGAIVVSGFDFTAGTNYTFTGTGTIDAYLTHGTIEGKYLNYAANNPEKLTPTGKLEKSGTGVLAFANGANTFHEGIEISGGTIAFTNGNQLGDGGHGITFLANGTLRADATGQTLGNNILINPGATATFNSQGHNLTVSGEISGNAIEKTGAGRVTLTNTLNNYTGQTTVSAGTLEAVGVETLGVNNIANVVAIATGATLEVNIGVGPETLNKRLTGAGQLEKTGNGELVLSQLNNIYSGGTVVSRGILTVQHVEQAGNNGGLGIGPTTIVSGAVLNFDILEDGTYSKRISGVGKVEKAGQFALTLTNSTSDYTGGTEIKGGRIIVTNENALGRNVSTGIVNMSGAGTSLEFVLPATGTFNQKIIGIGELIQTGPGALTLSNANTFSGGTQWNGGNLGVTNSGGLSATDGTGVAGFVFVNTSGTFSTDAASDTIQNRFEIARNETMTIDNELTIANNNVTGADGGAIELKAGASFIANDPLHLTDNTTDGDGGAVYAPTGHITIGGTGTNTVAALTDNSAVDGGGVYAGSVSVKAQAGGSTISGNTASGDGGAFYIVGGTAAGNTVSELDSTDGTLTLQGNTSQAGANAVHLNEYATLNVFGEYNIYLNDGITSKTGAASGNVVNINMPTIEDMNDRALHVNSVSDYFGDTNFNSGLMLLYANSRYGTIASDNVFTQYADGTLAGYGTVSANSILLGGTVNAGKYTPPPRQAEVATLNFIGTASIGELTGVGQTSMNVDVNVNQSQTADLMNVTGAVKINGDTLIDFNTFSVGKFLIVQTTGGVTGHTVGTPYYGKTSITDFETTIAGLAMNPSRFEIVYTLEDGGNNIYANLKLNNNYVIWTGANDYQRNISEAWPFNPDGVNRDDSYNNQWLNDPLYNWHQENDRGDYISRFRQGDKVAFVGDDPVETVQADYMEVRKNIVIVTHATDNDPGSGASTAKVADMLVTNGGTYRFTGAGIESSWLYDDTDLEDAAGQLYVTGHATAIFANAANNFQRGIVLQNGAVGFNDVNQLETIYVNDPFNGDATASHGITVIGASSYGILHANADNMELGIVINIVNADSEMVIDTGGNDFGDDDPVTGVVGNYTLTLTHAVVAGHSDPDLGPVTSVNGIYGAGRLVKAGTGTLILADANTYEGGSVVEEGTLAVAADDRLGKSGTSVILDGGTLRAMDSFSTNRAVVITENDGAVEVDANQTLTHTGLITDADATNSGDLTKTGEGTFTATNTANDFRGDLYVDQGRFVAMGLGTLGDEDSSRMLNTLNDNGTRSILELQVTGEQTLRQQLGGDGETLKTGDGQLNLAVNSPNFNGFLNVAEGSVFVTGDFGNGDSFLFQDGTMLSGYGTLGGKGVDGGVFASGSILAPGNVTADDPAVNPTSRSINVNGSVTFESGSLYRVVITQYPDSTYDPASPDRMRPVSDCLNVSGGTVTIASGAVLDVTLDYWADNLILFDFGEDTSGYWTIIDASDNGVPNDANETFTVADVELPRGIELEHGWNGDLYQLWLVGNPTGAFTSIGDSHNTIEVGTELEDLVINRDPGMTELIKILSQSTLDDATILDIMRQLAGDLRAESLAMAFKMPWRQPFNRLDRDMFPYVADPCEPITCRKVHKHYERQFWGEAYGRYTDTRSDGNAYSNRINRAGTVIGVDKQICPYSLFGAAFNYSEPHMTQYTGKVEMEDAEIGVYNMSKLVGLYDVKTYLGYSHQSYEMNRHVFIPAGNRYDAIYESFKNRTSGDGFAMSVELLRGFWYNRYLKFTPLIAVDYEYVWQKGYTEDGGMTALRHAATNAERLMFRVGMNVKAEVRDRLDLFGRIQYATQLNRTEFPRSNTYFAAAENPSTMDIWGNAIGRDYLNIGIGFEYYFKGTKRATSLYLNYDADLWKRQTTHTGNLGFVHRW